MAPFELVHERGAEPTRGLVACVALSSALPAKVSRRRLAVDIAPVRDDALVELAKVPPGRVRLLPGDQWSVRVRPSSRDPGPVPEPPASERAALASLRTGPKFDLRGKHRSKTLGHRGGLYPGG